jgi:putative transposase
VVRHEEAQNVEVLHRCVERVVVEAFLARADVFDYIEVFYNRNRRHSHLGGVSPDAFERASA